LSGNIWFGDFEMPILSMMLAQAALFGAEPLADPMAGVTPDWSLCTQPDDVAKTCHVLATFTKVGDDQYTEFDRSLIVGLPGLVIEAPSTAYLKNGRLCSVARRSDFVRARIVHHLDGASLQREAAAIKQINFMYPVEGKEVCGEFYPDGVELQIKSWVNGKPIDEMTTPARWVSKDDGYEVVGWRGVITTPPTSTP
jgi:hypothetical protein